MSIINATTLSGVLSPPYKLITLDLRNRSTSTWTFKSLYSGYQFDTSIWGNNIEVLGVRGLGQYGDILNNEIPFHMVNNRTIVAEGAPAGANTKTVIEFIKDNKFYSRRAPTAISIGYNDRSISVYDISINSLFDVSNAFAAFIGQSIITNENVYVVNAGSTLRLRAEAMSDTIDIYTLLPFWEVPLK